MKAGLIRAAAAAALLAVSVMAPGIGGHAPPRLTEDRYGPEYDGLGRKKRRTVAPRHNAKRRTQDWQDYANRVVETHRDLADGSWQEDPRDDKYLHSHARVYRALRTALKRGQAA